MRPGQQNKRGRGRNNNNGGGGGGNGGNFNRKGANPLTRTYDSSGPDVKIRGTAQHIAEKYTTLARDAHSAGDRVMAENYLQHAEHYNRIIAAAQVQMQDRFQRDDREDRAEFGDRDFSDRDDDMDGGDESPVVVQQAQPTQHRQPARQQQPQAQPQPVAPVAAPVVAGSGPQPIIEDAPVAAAAGDAAETDGSAERQPASRRNPAARPRRQPRRPAGEETATASDTGAEPAAAAGEAPTLVAVDSE